MIQFHRKLKHTFSRATALVCVSFLALFCFSAGHASESTSNPLIDKQLIAQQPEGTLIYSDSLAFSPDTKDVACVVFSDDHMQVVINKDVGENFDHIAKGYPVFSPAGNRTGYIADKSGKYFAVVDKKKSTGYEGACCLRFSPDGKHIAYIAKDAGKQFVVLNGNRLKAYDMVDQTAGVLFSPDSQTLAYIAKNTTDDGVRLILNGKESPVFDAISEISFGPHSNQTAYIILRKNEWYVINDQIKAGPYDKAQSLTWSPDGAHLAYIAIRDGDFWIIDNDKKISAGDYSPQGVFFKEGGFAAQAPRVTPPVFSPDSSLMAFTRIDGEKFRNVIGDTPGPLFDQVSTVIFSPDSRHYAYIAVERTSEGVRMRIIHDGIVNDAYDMIDRPFFSPDSKKLAYRVMDNRKWRMVVAGKAQRSFDVVDVPVFSPDSAKLAYRAMDQGRWLMVENGKTQKPYDVLGLPFFSPDSAKLAYRAIDDDKLTMVINSEETAFKVQKAFASLDKISRPFFSPDGQNIIYLALINPLQSFLVINNSAQLLNAGTLTTIDLPIVFESDSQARFLAAAINNKLFEIFRFNITITRQP